MILFVVALYHCWFCAAVVEILMSGIIKIRKGLDIPLEGAAQELTADARSVAEYAVKPTDYVGVVPRLLVAEGDIVGAGTPLFEDKNNEWARFVSPVAGRVKAVVRGERRALLAVVVERDESVPVERNFERDTVALEELSREEIQRVLMESGCWTMLRRRPFGTVPLPNDHPKAIFVSCFDTAPLAPDYDYVMQGREEDFVAGLRVLLRLTDGKLHLGFHKGQHLSERVPEDCRIEKHVFDGPHPAGNVGTQIAAIDPINKGEVVWSVRPQEVAVIGHLFLTGEYLPEKVVAFAGPCVASPRYYRILAGAGLDIVCSEQLAMSSNYRIISGNVLSGSRIAVPDSPLVTPFIGAADDLVTVIPEGDYYEFMGWLMPGLNKFSFHRTFFSGFDKKEIRRQRRRHRRSVREASRSFRLIPNAYTFDTQMHGQQRPLVLTGEFEQVFPFRIYPLQLIKAAVVGDIELMEDLGIYEVEPEDFALCEFIDPSKTEIQHIIREALETLRKEGV